MSFGGLHGELFNWSVSETWESIVFHKNYQLFFSNNNEKDMKYGVEVSLTSDVKVYLIC